MQAELDTMSNACCIVGCQTRYDNKDPGVELYRFPGRPFEASLRDRWIKAVNRHNPDGSSWRPQKWSRVCSNHFVGGKRSALSTYPTIFPNRREDVLSKWSQYSDQPTAIELEALSSEGVSVSVELMEVSDVDVQVDEEFPICPDRTFVFVTDRVNKNCVGVQCYLSSPEKLSSKFSSSETNY